MTHVLSALLSVSCFFIFIVVFSTLASMRGIYMSYDSIFLNFVTVALKLHLMQILHSSVSVGKDE